ncbi:unnamed protein product [Rotaria magnacalcarata]
MADKKKKFDACLIRTSNDEFIVAEWHQLITAANKSKLTVGSNVGYKNSTKKREKIIRGTIMIIGSMQVCEQQKKLLMAKINCKKPTARNFDDKNESDEQSECEEKNECEINSAAIVNSKNGLESDGEDSSDSSDRRLEIDMQEEEICDKDNSKTIQSKATTINEPRNDNQSETLATSSSNVTYIEEKATSSSTRKRAGSDSEIEYVESKKTKVSVKIEKYKSEWMPRPKDPSVIRYFIHMGGLLSSSGEDEEEKGDKLFTICEQLSMSEQQLRRLQKPNGTRTARSIIRACYPPHTRMDALEEGIKDDIRQAVQDYIQMFHAMEGLTEGKINESINNVFRSAKSQIKKDENNVSQQSTSNDSTSNKNNKGRGRI